MPQLHAGPRQARTVTGMSPAPATDLALSDRVLTYLAFVGAAFTIAWLATGSLAAAVITTLLTTGIGGIRTLWSKLAQPGMLGGLVLIGAPQIALVAWAGTLTPLYILTIALTVGGAAVTVASMLVMRAFPGRTWTIDLRDRLAAINSPLTSGWTARIIHTAAWLACGWIAAGTTGVLVAAVTTVMSYLVAGLASRQARTLQAADPDVIEAANVRQLLDGTGLDDVNVEELTWDAGLDALKRLVTVDGTDEQADVIWCGVLAVYRLEFHGSGFHAGTAATGYEAAQRTIAALTRLMSDAADPATVSPDGDVRPGTDVFRVMDLLLTAQENSTDRGQVELLAGMIEDMHGLFASARMDMNNGQVRLVYVPGDGAE
jgi:hypothetical protein